MLLQYFAMYHMYLFSILLNPFNCQVKTVYIYGLQHVLMYVYIVEWLKQAI